MEFDFLIDNELSLEAKGLLSLGLDLQRRNIPINMNCFITRCKESNFTISRIIKELIDKGYLIRVQSSNGKFQYLYQFYNKAVKDGDYRNVEIHT